MSWCADRMAVVYSYEQEAAVVRELPAELRHSMLAAGPHAWLFGQSL
jgi:hypothetical protein